MKFFALAALSAVASLASAVPHTFNSLAKRQNSTTFFYKGFDLSSLQVLEQANTIYKDTARNNETRPAEDILGDNGMNTVRLRLWVNPVPGQYDLNYTLSLAQRLNAKGYKIYIVYHFSDSWADPGKQITPAAWPQNDLPALSTTLRNYVRDTLVAFHEGGVDPAIVSLGNEIRTGMLWPLGRVDALLEPREDRIAGYQGLATLWNSARLGVDDAIAAGLVRPQVMIHVDNGFDQPMLTNWFDAIFATGKVTRDQVDIVGVTNYPFYSLDATPANLLSSLNAIADTYQIPIHVVETDWPVRCDGAPLADESIPRSIDGQRQWVKKMLDVVRAVNGGWGQGLNYWEPTWINNTSLGSPCQDNVLFEGDWSKWPEEIVGYSRPSVDILLQ
ncbi:putative arabinogalactan endo-beta-1,4-galactanase A [Elsinoe australis]|uniref:Arabinogalactan endo-beta-1,4-galactanase n=1 Tax=Elsinoe australis TaxID=40998 RepID=A0A4U7ASP6_9PEZI|nr:putative arabinogalactan endo-beta-1,4-galactanase A [Elsinoe australis]